MLQGKLLAALSLHGLCSELVTLFLLEPRASLKDTLVPEQGIYFPWEGDA